jgi:hypothetical protein
MHADLEKLIELTLADGQITEKERNVIMKKAAEFGEDLDEVDVILDAKLHQKQSYRTQSTKEKTGNIKTCPACGESVRAMEIKCSACDHEFVNVEANKSVSKLLEEIANIKRHSSQIDHHIEQKIAGLINSTPIPNTKEDLFEFLSVCCAQADVDLMARGTGIMTSAWTTKAEEAFLKAKIAFKNDNSSLSLLYEFEVKLKSAKRKSKISRLILIIFFVIALAGLSAMAFL